MCHQDERSRHPQTETPGKPRGKWKDYKEDDHEENGTTEVSRDPELAKGSESGSSGS